MPCAPKSETSEEQDMKFDALPLETHDGRTMGWCHETGNPTVATFGNALQVWAIAQHRDVTVGEAALVFNVTLDLIRYAVEEHGFMYLAGNFIQHDGE